MDDKSRGTTNAKHLATDTDHPPDDGSAGLPEPGSVKSKTGLFTARSTQKALDGERDEFATFRTRPPQQAAIAMQKPPVPVNKPVTLGRPNSTPELRQTESQGSDDRAEPGYPMSKPVRNMTAGADTVENLLQDNRELPVRNPPIPHRNPAMHSDTSPRPPDIASVSGTKPRPTPPPPRKGGAKPVPKSPSRNEPKIHGEKQSYIPLSNSDVDLTGADEARPTLPPRPDPSRVTHIPPSDHRILLEAHEHSKRHLTPSSPLLDRSLQNNGSSPDLIDYSPGLDEEAMSDAIVASSLASRKAFSAKKVPPPPPPQRQLRTHPLLRPNTPSSDSPRSSSPAPSLRHTLRPATKVGEEELDHHKHRKHIIRRHPHKHHEGDRKRWQSEVTEKERKRYEGVWAANKGLLIPISNSKERSSLEEVSCEGYPPSASEMVLNIAVREIWARSRLPSSILEKIWNLVDRQKIGLLTREEFVVGMWLIDQQLKGHKLPVEVPGSVWDSVRGVPGIRIPKVPSR
ncbi:Increased rDNA silencing protein [Aspergillus fumigatus]|nr:Increased rDNA silencing protein [Aspergillus fumigatus]KAH1737884.1 Increased rDNA silencing protein [Aspergillus fumigatus]KAH1934142.1 Increased rDNA silencing protein [Aspergillus fumigatus]KAH2092271.1 Increased rDNA silencing protein [Aspergillus fumigatus]KAH2150336.1 Increased rDNA silencing protein [Aspergillus fumigatus]